VVCSKCAGTGDLLCCDGCPRSWHYSCAGVNATELPPGEWRCPHCKSEERSRRRAQSRGVAGAAITPLALHLAGATAAAGAADASSLLSSGNAASQETTAAPLADAAAAGAAGAAGAPLAAGGEGCGSRGGGGRGNRAMKQLASDLRFGWSDIADDPLLLAAAGRKQVAFAAGLGAAGASRGRKRGVGAAAAAAGLPLGFTVPAFTGARSVRHLLPLAALAPPSQQLPLERMLRALRQSKAALAQDALAATGIFALEAAGAGGQGSGAGAAGAASSQSFSPLDGRRGAAPPSPSPQASAQRLGGDGPRAANRGRGRRSAARVQDGSAADDAAVDTDSAVNASSSMGAAALTSPVAPAGEGAPGASGPEQGPGPLQSGVKRLRAIAGNMLSVIGL
jgi:hypothetical protein